MIRIWKTLLLGFLLICFEGINAQSSGQLWLEYRSTFKFEQGYKLGVRASFRTNFFQPRWRITVLRFMPDKKFNKYFGGAIIFQIIHARQNHALATNEIRLAIGARVFFTPHKRIQASLLGRFEYRFVHENLEERWNNSLRIRLKSITELPFNRKDMSVDDVFYGRTDYEFFMIQTMENREVFSNRFRLELI